MLSSPGDNSVTSGSYRGRSESASSLTSSLDISGGGLDLVVVEDLDLMDHLVQDVRSLSEALNRLSAIIEGCETITQSEETQAYCIQVHGSLTDVMKTLKELMDRYSFLRCSEVLSPVSNLIHCVKELKFDDISNRSQDEKFGKALVATQKLQVAVAERVGDYLTWEMSHYESAFVKLSPSNEDIDMADYRDRQQRNSNLKQNYGANSSSTNSVSTSNGRAGNCRKILRRHSTYQSKAGQDSECSTEDTTDSILGNITDGVDHAFSRAKAWSKYCKEILQFVQRRISLETTHAKEVQKLAEQTRSVIQDEEFLPLQSTYVNSFKIELEFFENCTDTMRRLFDYKFVKPLEIRKRDHDTKRKELKILWDKNNKLLADTKADLRKARQNFHQRDASYKKTKEGSVKMEMTTVDKGKIEKRRKQEDDALLKREQAFRDCKTLENRLEERQKELNRTKAIILRELRELIYQCDQTTKACTVAYFQALSGLWALLPMQYQSLSDSARAYVPGMEFTQFIQALPKHLPNLTTNQTYLQQHRVSNDDLSLLPQFRKQISEPEKSPIRSPLEPHSSFPGFRDHP